MHLKRKLKATLMLTLWCVFFEPKWLVAVSCAVILHECAHLLMCTALGVRVSAIRALPWGLTATAPLMHEPFCQLAVSIAGPMCNFFLLLFCPLIEKLISPEAADIFALSNLADGLLNLIPALPLDGGIILKAFLSSFFGLAKGFSYMIRITAVTGCVLILLGVHIFIYTGSNASYLMAGFFIIYNLKHEKELIMCIRKRILTGEITSKPRPKKIYADHMSNAICLLDLVSPVYTINVLVTKNGKVVGSVCQKEIIENVLKNSMITVGECIEKN